MLGGDCGSGSAGAVLTHKLKVFSIDDGNELPLYDC